MKKVEGQTGGEKNSLDFHRSYVCSKNGKRGGLNAMLQGEDSNEVGAGILGGLEY